MFIENVKNITWSDTRLKLLYYVSALLSLPHRTWDASTGPRWLSPRNCCRWPSPADPWAFASAWRDSYDPLAYTHLAAHIHSLDQGTWRVWQQLMLRLCHRPTLATSRAQLRFLYFAWFCSNDLGWLDLRRCHSQPLYFSLLHSLNMLVLMGRLCRHLDIHTIRKKIIRVNSYCVDLIA